MKNPSLLIIDDNDTARQTLTALLAGSGYQIYTASSGAEGIASADNLHPDVILLDVMMPEMDGFEVCRILRKDPQQSEVPIILVTALDDRESRLMGLEAGADDFLTKPYDSVELEVRLRGLKQVSRYRHLQEEREKLQIAYSLLKDQNNELKLLSGKVIDIQEKERRRLAMELHDDLGQLITGLKITLESAISAQDQTILARCSEALKIANQLLFNVRELSLNLRPTLLDDLGLFAALDWFFKRFTQQTNIKIVHNINPLEEKRFSTLIETTAFRVIQEALTNAARHAGISELTVTVNLEPSLLKITIFDQGKGFNLEGMKPGESTGISGMRERVSWVGGNFTIQSAPGEGTMVLVEFPVKDEEES
jgi:signal transduction histidine kinase